MFRLQCVAQKYDWGLKGDESTVGRLYALGSGQPIDKSAPYAELWMGTHPSGPSQLILQDAEGLSLLKDWLVAHPEALGEKVNARWNGALPFLFKVLSVAKALSIQAHPDKALAERLHAEQPQHYKDDNHKPEMALALTPFEALCSFVPLEELKSNLDSVPELSAIVGPQGCQAVSAAARSASAEEQSGALKLAYCGLMTRGKEEVSNQVTKLRERLELEKTTRPLTPKELLVLRTEKQYPADIGLFSIFFLNYLTLQVGEAIYLAANEPHAYLSGECIECMAASDNVVRAGLTPKYKDTENLCQMLTYKQGLPEILTGTRVDKCTSVYTPPFDEFEVERSVVPIGDSYSLPLLNGPSILLVYKGEGAVTQEYGGSKTLSGLKVGDIFFVPAGAKVEVSATIDVGGRGHGAQVVEGEVLELYRARVNNRVA